jgi:hypothetical protein
VFEPVMDGNDKVLTGWVPASGQQLLAKFQRYVEQTSNVFDGFVSK